MMKPILMRASCLLYNPVRVRVHVHVHVAYLQVHIVVRVERILGELVWLHMYPRT